MTKWLDTTAFPNRGTPAGTDLLPIADMTQAEGSRQRTVTAAQFRAFASGVHVAAADPTAGDDNLDGYAVGSLWYATTSDDLFVATDVTTAAAVWATVVDASAIAGALTAGDDAATLGSGAAADGHVLMADGVGGAAFEAVAGGGDVVGPASAVDDRIATFDLTTGKLLQDGGVTVADLATAAQGALADTAVQPADPVVINAQVGTTYPLVLTDAGKLVTLSNGDPITLTVPLNSSVAFPVGTVVACAQIGAGLVSIAGAAGVTINGVDPGAEASSGQWASWSLTKLATDSWLASGGLA